MAAAIKSFLFAAVALNSYSSSPPSPTSF